MSSTSAKNKFKSRVDYHKTIAVPAGSRTEHEYIEVANDFGEIHLEQSGTTDIYNKIQEQLEDTLIYNILERYNSGDIDALEKVQSYYTDTIGMPDTLAGAYQQIIDARRAYEELPAEYRQEYGNPAELMQAVQDGRFAERFLRIKEVSPEERAKEIKDNEQKQ